MIDVDSQHSLFAIDVSLDDAPFRRNLSGSV
jgi:hypothetical protein